MMKRVLWLVLCAFSTTMMPMDSGPMSADALLDEAEHYEENTANWDGEKPASLRHAPKPLVMKRDAQVPKRRKKQRETIYLIPPYEPTCGNETERYCILGMATCCYAPFWLYDQITGKEKQD